MGPSGSQISSSRCLPSCCPSHPALHPLVSFYKKGRWPGLDLQFLRTARGNFSTGGSLDMMNRESIRSLDSGLLIQTGGWRDSPNFDQEAKCTFIYLAYLVTGNDFPPLLPTQWTPRQLHLAAASLGYLRHRLSATQKAYHLSEIYIQVP